MTHEYHLIDLAVGISHGGFETLAGDRRFAREEFSIAMSGWNTTIHVGRRRDCKKFDRPWPPIRFGTPPVPKEALPRGADAAQVADVTLTRRAAARLQFATI